MARCSSWRPTNGVPWPGGSSKRQSCWWELRGRLSRRSLTGKVGDTWVSLLLSVTGGIVEDVSKRDVDFGNVYFTDMSSDTWSLLGYCFRMAPVRRRQASSLEADQPRLAPQFHRAHPRHLLRTAGGQRPQHAEDGHRVFGSARVRWVVSLRFGEAGRHLSTEEACAGLRSIYGRHEGEYTPRAREGLRRDLQCGTSGRQKEVMVLEVSEKVEKAFGGIPNLSTTHNKCKNNTIRIVFYIYLFYIEHWICECLSAIMYNVLSKSINEYIIERYRIICFSRNYKNY